MCNPRDDEDQIFTILKCLNQKFSLTLLIIRVISLAHVFNEYKKTYGNDFIFADQNKDITLTSDLDLLIKGVTFKNLVDLL